MTSLDGRDGHLGALGLGSLMSTRNVLGLSPVSAPGAVPNLDRELIDARSKASRPFLVCRIQSRFWCLPVEHVVETMRPLKVEPLRGVPAYVRGLSIIRGVPVPVLDTRSLLGLPDGEPKRFVLVKAGRRTVALAVDEVVGVDAIALDQLEALPLLVDDAAAGVVSSIGSRDGELLLVLQSARLVPDSVWLDLDADERS